jgi:hypothetical protein
VCETPAEGVSSLVASGEVCSMRALAAQRADTTAIGSHTALGRCFSQEPPWAPARVRGRTAYQLRRLFWAYHSESGYAWWWPSRCAHGPGLTRPTLPVTVMES